MLLPDIVVWVKAVAEIMASLAVCWGFVRGLPAVMDRMRLVGERDAARREAALQIKENATLHEMVGTFGVGIEGWQTTILSLSNEIKELRAEVVEVRKLQIISARYNAALIRHITVQGVAANMPAIPDELREEVLEHLRSNQAATAAANAAATAATLAAAQNSAF